jgi:hypothetical protein
MAKPPSKAPPKPAAKASPAEKRYAPKTPPAPVHPITSPRIEHLAGKATRGEKMTPKEQQELGASVLRHIEPRKGGKP